jgi:hypothetical protein
VRIFKVKFHAQLAKAVLNLHHLEITWLVRPPDQLC